MRNYNSLLRRRRRQGQRKHQLAFVLSLFLQQHHYSSISASSTFFHSTSRPCCFIPSSSSSSSPIRKYRHHVATTKTSKSPTDILTRRYSIGIGNSKSLTTLQASSGGGTTDNSINMDSKRDSPSAQRNKEPIWDVLSTKIFESFKQNSDDDNNDDTETETPLRILEIAAGSGVHTEHFALQLKSLLSSSTSPTSTSSKSFVWYPSDPEEDSRASIKCYIRDNHLEEHVHEPLSLTLNMNGIQEMETMKTLSSSSSSSPSDNNNIDVIICINMIHISPWEATLGLMKLAKEKLSKKNGYLFCYGPYKVGGTAVESNLYVVFLF